MASSSALPPHDRDWNAVWSGRDLRQLTQIPTNKMGLCGCSLCGGPRVVSGRIFRSHMMQLFGSRPSPTKRARQLSPEVPPVVDQPPPSPLPLSPPSLPIVEPNDSMDYELDVAHGFYDDHASNSDNEDDNITGLGRMDEQERHGEQEVEQGLAEAEGPAGEDMFSFAELATMMEYANDAAFDIPPIQFQSPPPSVRTPSPAAPQHQSIGPFISAPVPAGDLLDRWPYDIPLTMREPEFSGARLNPHLMPTTDHTDLSVLHRLLPLLAHVLSGVFNVARRPVEMVLQGASAIVRYAENVQYARFKRWYISNHPNADDRLLRELELMDPTFDLPAAPATADAALRRIQVNSSLLVHPICRNVQCHHVFYDIVTRDLFSTLPKLCPECETPTRDAKGGYTVLHYPRRSLKAELEVVFRVPGVEQAIERRGERKKQRDEDDARGGMAPWGPVYRQQDDGTAWRDEVDDGSSTRRGLSITVNLSVDWANLSSRRGASTDSIGPITLQIGDLPPQLRASFSCAMILGITPGPKAPRAANLHKLLLPLVMELRDAQMNGIWIRTPACPLGRLVKVYLGCICCDRPAAVDVTGGPSFSAHASPCLRCCIHRNQIADLASYPHPPRPSFTHDVDILDQLQAVPLAVEEDRKRWAEEQAENIRLGRQHTIRRYPNYRRDGAIKEATTAVGNLSPLMLLPGYDKFPMTPFDPMHSLLEGAIRTYMHKVLVMGTHGTEGDQDVEQRGIESDAGMAVDYEADAEAEAGDDGEGSVASVASDAETDYASDGDAQAASTIAARVLGQVELGEVVVVTPEELTLLRKGVGRMSGKGGRAGRGKGKGKKDGSKSARRKKMLPKDMARFHEIISSVQTPSSIPRLHPEFGAPPAGKISANHWRVFATVIGPLSIPLLFRQRGKLDNRVTGGNAHLSPSELKAMMLLFEIVALSLRSSMSERQISSLESLIRSFQALAFALHPTLSASTNLHVISHLGEDIRKFGPTYGWWTFLVERINYIIKNVNQSGGNHFQASVVALRAAIKAREVVSTRMRVLTTNDDDEEMDKAVIQEFHDLFDAVSHEGASDVLQQVSIRYAEIEQHTLSGMGGYTTTKLSIKPRGRSASRSLNDVVLRKLQDCLAAYGMTTRTMLDTDPNMAVPYVPAQATFWEGIVFDGRRLDAAEWQQTIQLSLSSFEATELASSRNSLFESRRIDWIHGCEDRRARSGVLCAVFEHALVLADGTRGEQGLFGVIRRFKPFNGEDVYGYRSHPALGVWLWEADELEDAAIIRLTDVTTDTLRSLAIARLPQHVDAKGKASLQDIWATVPLSHLHVYNGYTQRDDART